MSILLALCLLAGLTPAAVLAEENAGAEETAYEEAAEEVGEEAAEPEEAAEAEAEEEEAGEAEGEANASENEEEAAAEAAEEADASAAEEEAAAEGEEEENASAEEAEAEEEAGIMLLTASVNCAHSSYDEKGFCTDCGAYQPAEKNASGYYEIGNVGQMLWFGALVNGDTTNAEFDAQDQSANAVLTADLDFSSYSDKKYIPIGYTSFDSSTTSYTDDTCIIGSNQSPR